MASKPLIAGEALEDMTESGPFPAVAMPEGMQLFPAPPHFGNDAAIDRGSPQRGAKHRRVALLARALEADVIPRLVLSRHIPVEPAYRGDPSLPGPTQADVETLAAHVMRGDLVGAGAFVAGLLARDLPVERIYLELFAPVARHLGDLWADDRCDFTSVTIGLCGLQQLVLDGSHSFAPRLGRQGPDRRILLAPVPGEQHSFGLVTVGEFFRRHGWDVCSATGASASELIAMVRKQWFSMVGLSLAGDGRLEPLATLIRDIRRTSRNPQVGLLVGGRLFTEQPELAALVGADATSSDGRQAVLKAETLLTLLSQETQ
jgi:methanogenic corrinoid protein MtbC1